MPSCEAQATDLERDVAKLEEDQRAMLEELQNAPPAPVPEEEEEEPETPGEQPAGDAARTHLAAGDGAAE